MRRLTAGMLVGLFSVASWAQSPGRDSTSIEAGGGKITIQYGTPTLDGRSIDEMIIPNFAWRIGMNDPTTIETTVELDFYGKKLPPGKYILFARPDEHKNWLLIVSNQESGSVLEPDSVVLEAPLFFVQDEQVQDVLKLTLSKSGVNNVWLTVAWGTYRLRSTFAAR